MCQEVIIVKRCITANRRPRAHGAAVGNKTRKKRATRAAASLASRHLASIIAELLGIFNVYEIPLKIPKPRTLQCYLFVLHAKK